jgi:hypothetical protein
VDQAKESPRETVISGGGDVELSREGPNVGASVRNLDTSGWSVEARARLDAERAYQAAFKAHPLRGITDQVTEASRAASEAPRWHASVREFRNGQTEACFWREVPDLARQAERSMSRDLAAMVPRGEGDREASSVRSGRRAKQRIRLLAKAMGVDSLWTLTYRANQVDRDLCVRHLAQFRRAVSGMLGEWRYIAVLEQQERGAWHIHLATHALARRIEANGVRWKSWDLMRSVWRRITGELGGNFDEARSNKRWSRDRVARSPGSIARYLAKYVAKDVEAAPLNRKRFSHSEGVALPEAQRVVFAGVEADAASLMDLAFSACKGRVSYAWWDSEREVFFVEAEPPDKCVEHLC